MIKVAIMGYGTVGSGVYEVIRTNQKSINKKVGQELEIKYVLDLREFPGDPVMDVLTHDFEEIINDEEVRIVAEVMGGLHPAYEFTRRCLEAGKSVCTSNKELVAEHGAELIQIAKDHQVNYLFEASVGRRYPDHPAAEFLFDGGRDSGDFRYPERHHQLYADQDGRGKPGL